MSSRAKLIHDLEARKLVEARWPQKPAARWVMCNECASWKEVAKGNHHPWCGCGSDNFRWEDERHGEKPQ